MRRRIVLLGISTLLAFGSLLIFIPIDEKVHATGRIHAERETYVRAAIDGILQDRKVEIGDEVEAGAVLAEFDASAPKGQLQTLEARISQARAELRLKKSKLEKMLKLPLPQEFRHTDEDYEIAKRKREQSRIDLERLNSLGDVGAVSKHYQETAQLALALAEAEFQKAENNRRIIQRGLEETILNEARAEIAATEENLRILEVERTELQAEIERHSVRAPEAGTVTLILKRSPGEMARKGDDLFHIAHGRRRFVRLFATERQYHRIARGQSVLMTSPAFDRLRHGHIRGTIVHTAIEAETSPTGESEKVYRVIASIDHTPQPLMLGTSIDAEIILRRAPLWRLLLPNPEVSPENHQPEPLTAGRRD